MSQVPFVTGVKRLDARFFSACQPARAVTGGTSGTTNLTHRVIYIGWWLSDADIPDLVSQWSKAGVTHVLFPFITQPDVTKRVMVKGSVIASYYQLSANSRQLMKSNFILGASYGGANAMPSPYSQIFAAGNYYAGANGPAILAADIICLSGPDISYYDLDVEHIDDNFPQCAQFLGEVSKALKAGKPGCIVSHAPQTPYFTPSYGNVYSLVYQNYAPYIDFFNIQYYNNGPSQTYDEIFINGEAAVYALIQGGMNPSYIAVGKAAQAGQVTNESFVPLYIPGDNSNTMTGFVQQAYGDSRLNGWTTSGGVMVWYFNTQGQPDADDNPSILGYFSNI